MSKKIKVLHLASFHGNIGDNANHSGFYGLASKIWDVKLEITKLEMREFYWKNLLFEKDFVELSNAHDLVIVGGGNYFELWLDDSQSGTSIDVSIETLRKINTPILFNALGVDIGMGYSEIASMKFKKFINYIANDDKYFLSVRNDGSFEAIESVLGKEYQKYFTKIPDGGFFSSVNLNAELNGINFDKDKVIGINLANDMGKIRFNNVIDGKKGISEDEFINEFAILVNDIMKQYEDIKIIFFPHIYSDMLIISKVISRVDDKLRRTRIAIAPYGCGEKASEYSFGLYSKCNLVMGTRFHSNVCSIANRVPTIGLYNYRQIKCLYSEIDSLDLCIDIREEGFSDNIKRLLDNIFYEYRDYKKRGKEILSKIEYDAHTAHREICHWVNNMMHKNVTKKSLLEQS